MEILLSRIVDIVASKIAALVIHFGLLIPILRADHWMWVRCVDGTDSSEHSVVSYSAKLYLLDFGLVITAV
jgi:hypothetical protein